MKDTEKLSFLAMIENRHEMIMDFLATYSEITVVFDSIILTVHLIAYEATMEHGSKNLTKTHMGLMWQTAVNYYKQALEHILARELDAGFALLRMATELARDAYAIGKDESRLDLWMHREERAEEYRRAFKFDKSNPAGEIAFRIYKITSRYGVHGHMTSLLHAKKGQKTEDAKGVLLSTDEKIIFTGLQIWLRAFFPIHALFCDSFQLNKAPVSSYKSFMELVTSLGPIIDGVDKHVGTKPKVLH